MFSETMFKVGASVLALLVVFAFSLAGSLARADDTVRETNTGSRIYVRDRGSKHKALINDRGEKVGYGVKRGSDWVYFTEGSRFTVDGDD